MTMVRDSSGSFMSGNINKKGRHLTRSASAVLVLAYECADRSDFGFGSVLVVFFWLGGFDFGQDLFACHVGDEFLIEFFKLSFAFFGAWKTGDSEREERQVLEEHVVICSIAEFVWNWIVVGELVSSTNVFAFLVLCVSDGGVGDFEIQEAFILGGWNKDCFNDNNGVIAVDKEWI